MAARILRLTAAFVLLSGQVASADDTYGTVDSAALTDEGVLVQISLTATGDIEPVDGSYEFPGYAFAEEVGARPLTVRVRNEIDPEDEFPTFAAADREIALQRFSYQEEVEGAEIRKILYSARVFGPEEAAPVPLFVTEDPLPALPALIAAGCLFTVCSAALVYNIMRECEGADVEFSLLSFSCSVSCGS